MKIFNAIEIKEWDQFTISNEPIGSIDLMERAAHECVQWIQQHISRSSPFAIFCGKGNNGGDGLAIARLLTELGRYVSVYIIEPGHKGSPEFQHNLERLHQTKAAIFYIQSEANLHQLPATTVVIDALFGSGLNRAVEDISKILIEFLNAGSNDVISIDVPSGLFIDKSSKGNTAIVAKDTLSFQTYKLAFMMAENASHIGKIHLLNIGLHPQFYENKGTSIEVVDKKLIQAIYKPRDQFAHKGNFGHALLIAGSYGKVGAAVLASTACLRAGAGLLTCHVPKCGYEILQSTIPEAMVVTDFNSSFITKIEDDFSKYDAIGIGPGMGTASETIGMLKDVLISCKKPLVIDADALNMIATQKDLLLHIPAYSIITPHPKEFERLFGPSENDFERINLAIAKAAEYRIVIILKGHHTLIATPEKKYYFNNTGNAGMATAGSGDSLTGILLGHLAQGYDPIQTALLGVYLHGLAGDIAAKKLSMEAMIAGDIVNNLGESYRTLQS